jgi:hypothetical protein
MTIAGAKKARGRPPKDTEAVNVRMSRDQLDALDAWIASQNRPIGRPEAIRAILAAGLVVMGTPVRSTGQDE